MTRLFAALYVTENLYNRWRSSGSLFAKARGLVLFDRIMAREVHRIRLNERPLDEYIDGAKP